MVPCSYSCVLSQGPLDRKAGLYYRYDRYYGQVLKCGIIGIKVGMIVGWVARWVGKREEA